jgi:hypothetical protein
MGKMLRVALILGMIWFGLEVYTEGVDGAFGGIFSSKKEAEAASHYVSTPKRVGQRVSASMQQSEERTRRLLRE